MTSIRFSVHALIRICRDTYVIEWLRKRPHTIYLKTIHTYIAEKKQCASFCEKKSAKIQFFDIVGAQALKSEKKNISISHHRYHHR